MPSVSRRQQKMMAMDLQRKRAGKKTKTGMTEKQMEEFASTKTKHLPMKADGKMPHKPMMKHPATKKKTTKPKKKK